MKIDLTEKQCIEELHKYLKNCDADELARLVGEIFGGECVANYHKNTYETIYEFTPNEFYYGWFGKEKK